MNYIKTKIATALMAIASMVSCSYLDVIPTEQPWLDDTMSDADAVRDFLYSCYGKVEGTGQLEEVSCDEVVISDMIGSHGQRMSWNQIDGTTASSWEWKSWYDGIGQCNLFKKLLAQSNPLGVTQEMKVEYNAQVDFLVAYYHFKLLTKYGPIPVIDHFMPAFTLIDEMPGRSHCDYVVKFICDKLDAAAKILPATRDASEFGLATSTLCYAIKSRVLLYAASDLWNGGYPYKEWKNKNYETPGYGRELFSHENDRSKWKKALEASDMAIKWAEGQGKHKLLTIENMPSRAQTIRYPYIPGKENLEDADKDTKDGDFKDYVMLMSLLLHSTPAEGNFEYIWGEIPAAEMDLWSHLPLNIMQRNNSWVTGYSLYGPTLNTIEKFYTENGKLPAKDPEFPEKKDWFKSAGIAGHHDIIKLCKGREPRFYAWFGFDGGEYSSVMVNGNPFFIDMKSTNKQGRNPQSNRNFSVTGFLTKKHVEPDLMFTMNNGQWGSNLNYLVPLIRLGELYLNRAECYAELDMVDEAIKDLNVIRRRAGVPELTKEDITADMPLIEWVRNERFIELFQEGHRYHDVRRWMIAPECLGKDVRRGLNVMAKYGPSFEEFNKPVIINQPFEWNNRMYLFPIYAEEVYSNPQMVQAPGY